MRGVIDLVQKQTIMPSSRYVRQCVTYDSEMELVLGSAHILLYVSYHPCYTDVVMKDI